jgi:hypothetical protein
MAPILNVVLSLLLPVSSAASALVKPSTLLSSRSTDGTEIVGGTTASLAEFPYIVSLTKNHTLWCGGMLLNPYTVLTAAHCSESPASPSLVTVRAGSAVRTTLCFSFRLCKYPLSWLCRMIYDTKPTRKPANTFIGMGFRRYSSKCVRVCGSSVV